MPQRDQSQQVQVNDAWRAHRAFLVDLAFRFLGDIGTAEDVVQEAFFRLLQSRVDDIIDERGWLITVTSRLCFDHLKSASSRRERPHDMADYPYGDHRPSSVDPADRVTLDDEVRLALLIMLQRLSPAERVVFVLHDVFAMPYATIATVVGSRVPTCRQLAHRARRKIHESRMSERGVESAQHHNVTSAFIQACATGDLDALLDVLSAEVAGEIDARAGVVVGANRVGPIILHYWGQPATVLVAQPISGQPAVLAFSKRKLVGVLALSIEDSKITKIHVSVQSSTLGPLRAQLGGER